VLSENLKCLRLAFVELHCFSNLDAPRSNCLSRRPHFPVPISIRKWATPFFDSCSYFRDAVISIMATLASQERIAISERTIGPDSSAPALRESKRLVLHLDTVEASQS